MEQSGIVVLQRTSQCRTTQQTKKVESNAAYICCCNFDISGPTYIDVERNI